MEALQSVSLVSDRIVIPIGPVNGKTRKGIPIPGGDGYLASRVTIKSHFPLDPGFCMTVNKAEGRTMDRVILCLSEQTVAKWTRRKLYVGVSRVKKGENIRLLLTGRNYVDKYVGLAYLLDLPKNRSVDVYFAGFERPYLNANWDTNAWDSERALKRLRTLEKSEETR